MSDGASDLERVKTAPSENLARGYSVVTDSLHFGLALFIRDFRTRYRRAFLGFFWALVPMITMMVVATLIVREMGIDTVAALGVPYPVFLVSGFVAWSIFRDGVYMPIQMCRRTRTILSSVSIPHFGVLIAAATYTLLNFMLLLPVMVAIFAWYGIVPDLTYLPLLIIAVVLLLSGGMVFGMFLAPISLVYLDIRYGIQFVFSLWMFLTPVFYYPPKDSLLEEVVFSNPVTYLVLLFRDSALGTAPSHLGTTAALVVGMVGLLAIGTRFYRRGLKIACQLI